MGGSVLESYAGKYSFRDRGFGDTLHWRLSCLHTLHRYSLDDEAKTQNLGAVLHVRRSLPSCKKANTCEDSVFGHRDISPSRHLAIHGDALISNVLFESWTRPVEFLNASLSALIDAIPLKCFSKLRNFLGAGVDGLRMQTVQTGTVLSCILN